MDSNGAVLFNSSDYASFGRRALASLIDLGIIVAAVIGIYFGMAYKYLPSEVKAMARSPEQQRLFKKAMAPHAGQSAMLDFAAFFICFIPIKRLRGGTLGYRLAGIRLIDFRGRTPSWWKLFLRLTITGAVGILVLMPYGLIAGRGGVNPIVQFGIVGASVIAGVLLLYHGCSTQARRQAVQDKWSGTWMVLRGAHPSGPGTLAYRTIFFGTYPVRYVDVEPLPIEAATTMGGETNIARAPAPINEGSAPITAEAR